MSPTWDPSRERSTVRHGDRKRHTGPGLTVGMETTRAAPFRVVSRSQAREILADMGIRDAEDQESILGDLQNMSDRPNSFEYDNRQVTSAGKVFLNAQQRQEAHVKANEPEVVQEEIVSLTRGEFVGLAEDHGISHRDVDAALAAGEIKSAYKEGNRWIIPESEATEWIGLHKESE